MILDKISIILKNSKQVSNLPFYVLHSITQEGYILREEYQSTAMMHCRQNYVFEKGEGVIYIGFTLNTFKEQAEGIKRAKLEYNPAKIVLPVALCDFLYLQYYKVDHIHSIDIAFDYLHKRLTDFNIHTKRKVMYVGQFSNLTRYIAPNERHGRIKIYDKSKERSAKGFKIDQTIRVEITCRKPTFYENDFISDDDWIYLEDIVKRLQEVSITKSTKWSMPDGLQDHVIYLLQSVPAETRENAFQLMSYKTRVKYRSFFTSVNATPLQVSIVDLHKSISNQIRQCINEIIPHSYNV